MREYIEGIGSGENPIVTYYRLAERILSWHIPDQERQAALSDLELILNQATQNPVSGGANLNALRYILNELPEGFFIAVDIDNFKQYNDSYGHNEGNVVLREFVQFLDGALRGEEKIRSTLPDLKPRKNFQTHADLYHPHGEEFIIVAHAKNYDEAEKLANRLLRGWHLHTHDNPEKFKRSVTFSAGIAHYKRGEGSTIDAIQRADMACLKAKELGKNQVHVEKTNSLLPQG